MALLCRPRPYCLLRDACILQVVWSDEEKWVNPLKCSLDQLSKPSNSLEQVLERATSILKSVDTEGGVASEDEGEELEEGDNEEEFDDYYDDDHDVDEQVEKQRYHTERLHCLLLHSNFGGQWSIRGHVQTCHNDVRGLGP